MAKNRSGTEKRKRNRQVCVRLNVLEEEKMERIAKQHDISLAEVFRRMLLYYKE